MLAGSHFGWQAQLPNPVQKFKPEIPPWSIQTFPTAFGSSLVHDVGDQASLGVLGRGSIFSKSQSIYKQVVLHIPSSPTSASNASLVQLLVLEVRYGLGEHGAK